MATLGTDFAGIDDIDADLSVTDGRIGLAQAIATRLGTPRFGLYYDGNYGYDLRSEIGKPQGAANRVTAHRIETETLKDERISDASASVEYVQVADAPDQSNDTLTITLSITDDDGPFELVLSVDDVSVSLLEVNV